MSSRELHIRSTLSRWGILVAERTCSPALWENRLTRRRQKTSNQKPGGQEMRDTVIYQSRKFPRTVSTSLERSLRTRDARRPTTLQSTASAAVVPRLLWSNDERHPVACVSAECYFVFHVQQRAAPCAAWWRLAERIIAKEASPGSCSNRWPVKEVASAGGCTCQSCCCTSSSGACASAHVLLVCSRAIAHLPRSGTISCEAAW